MRRPIMLVIALAIALLGTGLIVLYVQGIDERAADGEEMVEVLVATATIDQGEEVAAAEDAEKFKKKSVRKADVVEGALTTTSSIIDDIALGTVYPGEQIIPAKFGSASQSGALTIPDGKIAVSVELTDSERVAGFVTPGSEVAIFFSADPVLKLSDGDERTLPPLTRLLLPKVNVIGVGTTSMSAKTTKTDEGESVTEQVPSTILTVAVSQKEAEKLIYAGRNADVSFALLSSDSKVKDQPGVGAEELMPESFRGLL